MIKTKIVSDSARIAFFTMISDSVRHSIINYLLEHKESSVKNLIKTLDKPQTLISYHLHCLKDCGLLKSTKSENDGRKIIYFLHDPEFVKNLFEIVDNYLILHENCETHIACRVKQ